MKFVGIIFKNLLRTPVRAILTSLAVLVLVVILSMVATVLLSLESAMTARAADVPVVVTDRYKIPSRFDRSLFDDITEGNTATELEKAASFKKDNSTIWHFIGFNLDPELRDKDLQFFCIATIPDKIRTMIDELENLDPALTTAMQNPPNDKTAIGMLMGPDRLKKIRKKVGDVFEATAISHRDANRQPIKMKLEIVGTLPGNTRWAPSAFIDYAALDRVLEANQCDLDGKVMLGWLKLDDQQKASTASGVIEERIPELKSEIASSAVSRFLEPYKPLFNIVKFLLAPAMVIIMVVIIANSISITVRERTREMAVMKVLGFSPGLILFLVLGEAMLLGMLGGFAGAVITYVMVNYVAGGINIPIGFFPVFFVPWHALWWGPVVGGLAAFLGGILPAWGARAVKVSEVFSRVA